MSTKIYCTPLLHIGPLLQLPKGKVKWYWILSKNVPNCHMHVKIPGPFYLENRSKPSKATSTQHPSTLVLPEYYQKQSLNCTQYGNVPKIDVLGRCDLEITSR